MRNISKKAKKLFMTTKFHSKRKIFIALHINLSSEFFSNGRIGLVATFG